jgi:hypothetical protein
MTTNMMVAETIKAQLGGGSAMYMIGAKDLVALDGNGGLQFGVMKNAKGVTKVRIELADDDTYTVVCFKIARRTYEITELSRSEMVYADSLRATLEQATGLYLSL